MILGGPKFLHLESVPARVPQLRPQMWRGSYKPLSIASSEFLTESLGRIEGILSQATKLCSGLLCGDNKEKDKESCSSAVVSVNVYLEISAHL